MSAQNTLRSYSLTLSESEVKALIDWHECQQEEADTVGLECSGNKERAQALGAALAGSAQPAPTWEAIYSAWQAVGADLKGLSWGDFVDAVSPAPDAPVSGLESVPRDDGQERQAFDEWRNRHVNEHGFMPGPVDAWKARAALAAAPTAAQPAPQKPGAEIDALVNRFLCWRLPDDFAPDCGIGFDGRKDDPWNKNKTWPVGTNPLTAEQARAMLLYVLGGEK